MYSRWTCINDLGDFLPWASNKFKDGSNNLTHLLLQICSQRTLEASSQVHKNLHFWRLTTLVGCLLYYYYLIRHYALWRWFVSLLSPSHLLCWFQLPNAKPTISGRQLLTSPPELFWSWCGFCSVRGSRLPWWVWWCSPTPSHLLLRFLREFQLLLSNYCMKMYLW